MKVINFDQYKKLQKMTKNELDRWIKSFWQSAADEGAEYERKQISEQSEGYTEEGLIEVLLTIRGVGPVLAERIADVLLTEGSGNYDLCQQRDD